MAPLLGPDLSTQGRGGKTRHACLGQHFPDHFDDHHTLDPGRQQDGLKKTLKEAKLGGLLHDVKWGAQPARWWNGGPGKCSIHVDCHYKASKPCPSTVIRFRETGEFQPWARLTMSSMHRHAATTMHMEATHRQGSFPVNVRGSGVPC